MKGPITSGDIDDLLEHPSICSLNSPSTILNINNIEPSTKLKEDDVTIEDFIRSEVRSAAIDFLDCPIRLDHKPHVPYVKYNYLCHITNHFHPSTKIGNGTLSEVFKGVTETSNIPMAIKRIRSDCDEARKMMISEGNENNETIV